MGDHAFDADTRVEPFSAGDGPRGDSDAGEFLATVTGRWGGITGVPNGGYLLAACTRALGVRMPFPDPIVVSGFFLRPGSAGPAAVRTSLVRSGRTTAFGEAVLAQDGRDVVRAAAAFSRLGASGLSYADGAPPSL